MAELMNRCSFAVSAGGNTLYELICCKIPTVCIALSPDQENLGTKLSASNLVSYCGNCIKDPDFCAESVINELEKLMNSDENTIREIKEKMNSFTDGLGAERIAKALTEL